MKHILRCQVFVLALFFVSKVSIGQVLINEYSVSNYSTYLDNFGGYEDWIELYNAGATPVNLTGYHLSEKTTNLGKWTFGNVTINAGGFLRIWSSKRNINAGANLHTNFNLQQCQGEKIIFSSPSFVIIDSLTLKKTQVAHSRGRTTNGAATWSVFSNPTPNASNNTATPYLGYTPTPSMSLVQGFYTGTQILTITCSDPSATIRTTTNGTTPTATASLYGGPMTIASTRVIRARATSTLAGFLPSFIENNTYFINVTHSVNVVSVFGDQINTLLGGTTITAESGLEYFNETGVYKAEAYGHSNEHGNDSWAYAQRGIDFVCRDEFGISDALKYQIFNSKPRAEFQRIILKAAANDNYPFEGTPNSNFAGELGGAHIRDQYVHVVAEKAGLHLDGRSWAPAVMYRNGSYWGVYDVREKVDDKDFTDYYYNTKDDSLQFLQTWGTTWSAYGGAQAQTDWNTFKNWFLLGSTNINNPATYATVDSIYNLKSLADYVILNSYVVCTDWLNWNTAWWRGLNYQADKKKWRYAIWDEDATFKHYINYTNLPNVDINADPCDPSTLNNPGGQGHVPILNKLLTSNTFKQYYVMRYFDLINTGLSCKRMTDILDSMVLVITPEMNGQVTRWGGTYSQWQSNVTALKSFIQARCDTVKKLFNACYNVTGPYTIKINVDPPNSGKVDFNSLNISTFLWQGTYPGNLNNILKAHPNTQYCFSHWTTKTHTLSPNMTDSVVGLFLSANDSIVAHFIYNPTPTVTPSSANVCIGGTVQIQAGNGLNYAWLPNTGLSCTTCTNPVSTPTANMIYTVTSVASASLNCKATQTVAVSLIGNPQITSSPTSTSVCPGGTVQLQAANGINYNWAPSTGLSCSTCSNPVASPLVNTTYTVTSNAALNCNTTSTLTVLMTSNPQVTASPSVAACVGGNVQIQASNGVNYNWSPSTGLSCTTCSNPIVTPTAPTIYTVTSNAGPGCNTFTTVAVGVDPYASAAFTATNNVTNTFPQTINVTNNSTLATSYYWSLSNGNTSTASVPSFVVNNGGTYTLTLIAINGNGCNDTTSTIIVVNDVAVSLTMPNVFTPNGDGVNDFFYPVMTSFSRISCSIYDRWGVLVYEFSSLTDKWNGENTKGKEVPAGTYFYTFNGTDVNGKNYVRKGFVSLSR